MIEPHIDHDKAIGTLAGVAVGDALGWPQENRSNIVGGAAARDVAPQPQFRSWVRNGGTQYGRYQDPVAAGEYSDDTQLTLSVARACLAGDGWYGHLTGFELPFWPTYQRGGGGAVLNASRAWGDGRAPWVAGTSRGADTKVTRYFDAGANGVAMRIAPHAILTARSQSEHELVRRVVLDGITTHGHPRALVGAAVLALGIRHALRHTGTLEYGELLDVVARSSAWRDPSVLMSAVPEQWIERHSQYSVGETRQHPARLWERTCDELDDLIQIAQDGLAKGATANDERTLGAMGVFDKARLGAGTVCAVAALYVAARTAPRPMSGLMRTAFLRGADTDTIASMTAALLGALQGWQWMNALHHDVQDRDYLADLALRLAAVANGGNADLRRSEWMIDGHSSSTSVNRRWVKDLFEFGQVTPTPDGRDAQVLAMHELGARSSSIVTRARLGLRDGQTLIIDRVAKTPAAALARPSRDRDTDVITLHPDNAQDDAQTDSAALGAEEAISNKAVGSPNNRSDSDPGPSVIAVELRVPDLEATHEFFANVLGFDCVRINAERSTAGPLLVLSQAKLAKPGLSPSADFGSSAMSSVVNISAHDLDVLENRALATGSRVQRARGGGVLWLLEPGGNVIRAVHSDLLLTPAIIGGAAPSALAEGETPRNSIAGSSSADDEGSPPVRQGTLNAENTVDGAEENSLATTSDEVAEVQESLFDN